MKFLYVFAFLFLAVFLLVTAAVGFGMVVLTPVVTNVLSFSALVSGVMFAVIVVKHLTDKNCKTCCHTDVNTDVREVERK